MGIARASAVNFSLVGLSLVFYSYIQKPGHISVFYLGAMLSFVLGVGSYLAWRLLVRHYCSLAFSQFIFHYNKEYENNLGNKMTANIGLQVDAAARRD